VQKVLSQELQEIPLHSPLYFDSISTLTLLHIFSVSASLWIDLVVVLLAQSSLNDG